MSRGKSFLAVDPCSKLLMPTAVLQTSAAKDNCLSNGDVLTGKRPGHRPWAEEMYRVDFTGIEVNRLHQGNVVSPEKYGVAPPLLQAGSARMGGIGTGVKVYWKHAPL